MHLYYPRSKVFLTCIYKNGSTSAKNFFGAFEMYLDESKLDIDDINNQVHPQLRYAEPPWKVHSDNELSKKYVVDHDIENNDVCSIVILRNPLERFSSFWFNKMVLMGEVTYFKMAMKFFPNSDIKSMDQIRESAKEFLKSSDFQEIFLTDIHLQPQHFSIQKNRAYNLYVETSLLGELPSILSEKFARYKILKHTVFPHFNSTLPEYMSKFYDQELVDVIERYYREDFDLLDLISFPSISKIETGISEPSFPIMEVINKQRTNNVLFLLPSIL